MKKNQNFLLILLLLLSSSFCLNGQSQEDEEYDHQILISFTSAGVSSFDAEEAGCLLLNEIPDINVEVWCVKDTLTHGDTTIIGLPNIIEYLESFVGVVEYAEPNHEIFLFEDPNDTNYGKQWGMPKIDAPEAWEVSEGSGDVVVAVFDTGIDWSHPDLINNIWQNLGEDLDGDGTVLEWDGNLNRWVYDPDDVNGIDDDGNGYADDFIGWNFVEQNNEVYNECSGHGTHVSGIIGAEGGNNLGVIGVSPNIKLMTINIFEPFIFNGTLMDCTGHIAAAIEGLYYAVEMGADISNHSYGSDYVSVTHRQAILDAGENNHLFVAAAGNKNQDSDSEPQYPAAYDVDNIISVGASDDEDRKTLGDKGSNYGELSVDLFAPGIDIYSTIPTEDNGLNPDGEYGYKKGTSMASPHVAGVAALIKATCEDADHLAIKEAILNSVDEVSNFENICVSGGRLNAFDALNTFNANNECRSTSCLEPDSLILVALYESTNGLDWSTPWNLEKPVSTWQGVRLSEDGCNVTCIDLDGAADWKSTTNGNGNGLEGNIPAELSKLSKLEGLFLAKNALNGSIPPRLGALLALNSLDLSYNEISGKIPSELGELSKLEELLLRDNSINGEIPLELGSLGSLICLNLSYNELSGKIPDDLENLFNLEKIYLNSNNLEGCYPELCKVGLGDFDFSDNPDLVDGGSDDGFEDFCDGIGPCKECIPYLLYLGPNRYTCGSPVILTTNLPNAESTNWTHNGVNVGNEETIVVYSPGTYTVTVTDLCRNEYIKSIEVIEANGCVWPGDASYNGIVDIYDHIPMNADHVLGMAGPIRQNATTDWIGQPYHEGESWDRDSFFEVNDIHSDANGDGKLNDDDHDVITLNYGKTHGDQALSRPALPNGFMVTQEFANQELAMASSDSPDDDKFVFNLILKQEDINALGVGCKINLGENKVEHAEFVYNSDFFGEHKPFQYFDKENNNLDIAIAIAKENRFIKGGGIIGKIIINNENIESFKLEDVKMKEVVLVDEKEQSFNLNGGESDYSSMVDINKIELKAGWNLLSFDIIPYDLSLKSVFKNLKPNNLEQVVAYDNGAFVFDPNIDAVFNTMEEYMPGLGYWVKVKEDDTLALPGFVPQDLRPGKLNLGWNLIGFQSEETCLARLYFEELGADDNAVYATTSRGEEIVYDPLRDWDSAFNVLEKGDGMWLKTERPMNGGSDEIANSTNVFEFIYGKCNLPKGEKIIVKDSNGLARGSFTVLDDDGKFKTNAVYGDDPRTVDLMEGVPIGSPVSFSWRNQVLEDVHVFNGDMGFEYLDLEFSLEEEDINLPENLEVNLFPNPVVNEVVFNVNFFNPTEEATVDIYNFSGGVIFSFKENIKGAVIGEFRYDLSDLPLGKYFYKVSNKEYSYSNSFIKTD